MSTIVTYSYIYSASHLCLCPVARIARPCNGCSTACAVLLCVLVVAEAQNVHCVAKGLCTVCCCVRVHSFSHILSSVVFKQLVDLVVALALLRSLHKFLQCVYLHFFLSLLQCMYYACKAFTLQALLHVLLVFPVQQVLAHHKFVLLLQARFNFACEHVLVAALQVCFCLHLHCAILSFISALNKNAVELHAVPLLALRCCSVITITQCKRSVKRIYKLLRLFQPPATLVPAAQFTLL